MRFSVNLTHWIYKEIRAKKLNSTYSDYKLFIVNKNIQLFLKNTLKGWVTFLKKRYKQA